MMMILHINERYVWLIDTKVGQFKTNNKLWIYLLTTECVRECVYSNRMKRENKFVEYGEHGRKADRMNLVVKASCKYTFV